MASITLAQLAQKLNAKLHGCPDVEIYSIASLETATKGQLTFLFNSKYRAYIASSQASAIIAKKEDVQEGNGNFLVMDNPYLGYALAAKIFDSTPSCANDIAPSAYISPSAKLGEGVSIGHNAVIEDGVVLGDRVQIGAGCFVGKNTELGANTRLWANVTIYHNIIMGESCLVQSGSVIGADGFGYANDKGCWIKIPQIGRVVIGSRVEIGACTTIDRGALEDTIVGNGVIIDNQCQIGHNVSLGDNTAIAGGSIIGGSTKVGSHCNIAGGCVVNGHINITDGTTITGMGMVMKPISESGVYSSGIPLQPNLKWRKSTARVMQIEDMHKRLKTIEKKIANNK